MITWFQVAYISAKLLSAGNSFRLMTPIETGDNEDEFCRGLDAFVEVEQGFN